MLFCYNLFIILVYCHFYYCVLIITLLNILDTRALVKFCEEDTTAIVPVNRISIDGITDGTKVSEGKRCYVRWSNRKSYEASFIISGKTT